MLHVSSLSQDCIGDQASQGQAVQWPVSTWAEVRQESLCVPQVGGLGGKTLTKFLNKEKRHDICEQRQSSTVGRVHMRELAPRLSLESADQSRGYAQSLWATGAWVPHLACAAVLVNVPTPQHSCNSGFIMCLPYHILIILQI